MNQWLQKLKKDKNFRVLWISFINMGWNLIYSLYNGILAIVYHSYWFFTTFVYYLALSHMRASIIKADRKSIRPTIRICGLGIMMLSIVIAGVVTLSIVEKRNNQYPLIVMIVMAAYTFYLIIHAVIESIRAHQSHNCRIAVLRNISLVSAIGAMLSLERSMLGTFGNPFSSFTLIMEAASGFIGFVLIVLIGLETFQSSKKTRHLR